MPADTLLVDGEWRTGTSTFEVVDPATLQVVGTAADGEPSDALAMLDAACTAFGARHQVGAEARANGLHAAAAEIRASADTLAALLTSENGKPLAEAKGEVLGSARMLAWAAEEARRGYGRVTDASPGPGLVLQAPVGPALAISPWNFPASMLVRKLGLALAAGCPVIVKPAEQTPLVGVELARIVAEHSGLPDGWVQVLTTSRPAAVAEALLADRRLRKVSFTGSTEVGLGLLRATDTHLRRTSLELGGHCPAIVFADADLETAAAGVAASKFANAGQSCIAVNRLYVHRSIREELLSLVLEKAAALRPGHGASEGTTLGPLIDFAGLDKVERHVADAVKKGATVLTGGQRATPDDGELTGAFYQPTVLDGADDSMLVTTEETFGPVLPVYGFDDDDEAVSRANATDYGLASYVYGSDLARVWRALERLDSGVVAVNDPFPVRPELPFGGTGNSGLEREGGAEGIHAYLETKSVSMRL